MYTTYLPKNASPFVYLALDIDPKNVDVNVHPTKSEVHFLHEDEIIDAAVCAVEKALAGANASRSFTVQVSLISDVTADRQTMLPGADALDKRGESSTHRPKSAPNYKVRMDPANRTLDSMITVAAPSQISAYNERPAKRRNIGDDDDDDIVLVDDETPLSNATQDTGMRDVPESVCEFTSIQELRRAVRKRASPGELRRFPSKLTTADLTETIAKHAFVGLVDRGMCLSLVQHQTRLLLVNHAAMG